MKTLTEFSALVLRKAADARAKAPRPTAPPPAETVSSEPAQESAPVEGAEAAPAEAAPADEASEAAPVEAAEAAPAEAAEAAPAEAAEAAPAEAAPAAADPAIDFVANELGVQPDRAARLLEALDIVGNRLDEVRLVRVYQGEKGPHNAVSRGEYHYAIDKVAGAPRRERRGGGDRDNRRGGGDRGGGGGGGGGGRGGFGGPGGGGRDKPRGLGSLKVGAAKEERDPRDDRPGRGEMPRAGIGWQLTAAPRDFGGGAGRGGPKRGRGPGRPGDDRGRDDRGRGRRDDRPRGPGGPRGPRHEGGGPRFEGGGPRFEGGGPRHEGGGPRSNEHGAAPSHAGAPHTDEALRHQARPEGGPPPGPRLGPDGQPLPPRSKRPRKPIGPDANGLGPDGTPWDPERRAKRQAERGTSPAGEAPPVNTPPAPAVDPTAPPFGGAAGRAQVPAGDAETPTKSE